MSPSSGDRGALGAENFWTWPSASEALVGVGLYAFSSLRYRSCTRSAIAERSDCFSQSYQLDGIPCRMAVGTIIVLRWVQACCRATRAIARRCFRVSTGVRVCN